MYKIVKISRSTLRLSKDAIINNSTLRNIQMSVVNLFSKFGIPFLKRFIRKKRKVRISCMIPAIKRVPILRWILSLYNVSITPPMGNSKDSETVKKR